MRPLLLLDEHVPVALVGALRQHGVDAVHVVDTSLRGASDETLLTEAGRMGRTLVSYNVRDFYQLAIAWAQEGREHAGVLLVRGQPSVGDLTRRLLDVLHRHTEGGLRNAVLFV